MSRAAPRGRGFTLVELLVVMALLSLMVLAMASALRTVAQSQESVDHRLTRIDDYRLAVGFIRDTLGRISARRQASGASENASPYLFNGVQDAVAWVGIMPARHGLGGRHFFRLGLESVDGRGVLVLRFAPWNPEAAAFPDWATVDSRIFADDVHAISMRYEDEREDPSVWNAEWQDAAQLPSRVAIDIATASGAWPTLVIPLRKLPLSDASSNAFSVGGGRNR